VLVGPAEGWKVDKRGTIVGLTTGRHVMLLDDLLTAFRTARQAAQGGIGCSIDPTDEGVVRFNQFMGQFQTMGNPQLVASGAERAVGAQNVTVFGVPETSHFARVLLAADYRMKRLAMNFEPSPVRGLPSFLSMMKGTTRRATNALPRWWLEPNYEPLLRSADGLAWELRGSAVKAMTMEDFVAADGSRQASGKASPLAQKWADKMTEHFDELAVAEPIFGQMRNCMELAIIGALISKERLAEKAGHSMSTLMDPTVVKTVELTAAKHVDSKASLLKRGRTWMVSVSGGVQIDSWFIADNVEQSAAPAEAREVAAKRMQDHWWWN